MDNKMTFKNFSNKILTGMSIGIVVALVPSALLGEIAKALNLDMVEMITGLAGKLLAVTMGLCIAKQFDFTPIQSGTLAISTMIGAGAIKMTDGALVLAGLGDVINAGLTATIAVLMILLIGNRLKAYTILLLPTIVITLSGYIGILTLPYIAKITGFLGDIVANFTNLQPILMGILMAIMFAFIIMSPVSSVGVAVAVSLSGIGSGTANLGICSAGFGLAILGYSVNGLGTSLAHFLGSPKMQMANLVKKPIMFIPILVNAGIMGALGAIFNIQGTPMSAGFGISGLIGPINYLNIAGYSTGTIVTAVGIFVLAPVILSYIFKVIFMDKLKIVKPEDYLIEFK